MAGAGRLCVPLAAIALVAMAGRAGRIDRPGVVRVAAAGLAVAVGLATVLAVPGGILAGLTFLALEVADRLPPAGPAGTPPA